MSKARPQFAIGDIIRLKKPHPCGGYLWKITRLGADLGLSCLNCERQVMLARSEVERRLKEVVERQKGE